MHRNSLVEMSGRAMHQAVRMVMRGQANDSPMMQEMDFGGMIQDGRNLVERVQAFGFSSVPLPPIVKKALAAAGGGGAKSVEAFAEGGGGAGGEGGQGGAEAPEGIALFLGGQRNHPVVIAIDDRRHRPMGLKPGENAQYDDIQQMTLMRRNGLYLLSNDNPDAEGKTSERMVSLRHVEKKKQERKPEEPRATQQKLGRPLTRMEMAAAMARKAAADQQKSEHKHEGETVNTELRVTKKKIEFRNGDEVVAEHDKQSKKWDYKGKEFNVNSEDHANIKPGKNVNINPGQSTNITSPTVAINGATGVNITGPTTVNGNPIAMAAHVEALEQLVTSLLIRVQALEAQL